MARCGRRLISIFFARGDYGSVWTSFLLPCTRFVDRLAVVFEADVGQLHPTE